MNDRVSDLAGADIPDRDRRGGVVVSRNCRIDNVRVLFYGGLVQVAFQSAKPLVKMRELLRVGS